MNNSNKNDDSISDIATKVAQNSVSPALKAVRKAVAVEPTAGPPIKDIQFSGPLPIDGKNPTAVEIGGTDGPEPTRYGDWEHKGRCYDF